MTGLTERDYLHWGCGTAGVAHRVNDPQGVRRTAEVCLVTFTGTAKMKG